MGAQHSFLLECGLNLNLVTKDKKYCCKNFNKNSKFKSPSNTASQKWQKVEKIPIISILPVISKNQKLKCCDKCKPYFAPVHKLSIQNTDL